MTSIGYSYGPDTITVAPRDDFMAFFELMQKAHGQGLRISTFTNCLGKSQFPLIADKLWRGWVAFEEIDGLEKELHRAKDLFATMPYSLLDAKNFSKDPKLKLSEENLREVFALILDKLEKSISGSRNYYKLGEPKYAVRVIVTEIPASFTMHRLPEEAFFKLDEPPLWTFYNESRENVIVLDASDW